MKSDTRTNLERLRQLREWVRQLNSPLKADFQRFLHPNGLTFTQKPKTSAEISKDDVRIAKGKIDASTTSTVLMALCVANKISLFYDQNSNIKAHKTVASPIDTAPTSPTVLIDSIAPAAPVDTTAPVAVVTPLEPAAPSVPLNASIALAAPAAPIGSAAVKPGSVQDVKLPLESAIVTLYQEPWTSVGLKDLNFFTAALVFRSLGFLAQGDPNIKNVFSGLNHQTHSYTYLVSIFGESAPKDRSVGAAEESRYPLTPTLVYWLMDAAEKLSWELSPEAWLRWAEWASDQFHHQFSYVTAHDDASMDPVALAMAACLVAKIQRIAELNKMGTARRQVERILPSRERLKAALPELFSRQGQSGIWPKYFPLFVYPDHGLVNHCFAFELMEALLNEFPEELIQDYLSGIEKSVGWCEKYRIPAHLHENDNKPYSGWNSGSNLQGLRDGYPECWATAVVHMFLAKLDVTLSEAIQTKLLVEYGEPPEKKSKWNILLTAPVALSGKTQDLKKILRDILDNWDKGDPEKRKRSALLFGPPGTSKTSLVKHLAAECNWSCVSINPSHFLRDGLERTFGRANEIFVDLMDLSRVVVFFDEMDPLVQRRKSDSDIHHQSLTTVFLPKLADLYNKNQIAFFMATNHIQQIDPAIRRPGRFDYLLFVGPPQWEDKCKALAKDEAYKLLSEWTSKWAEATSGSQIKEQEGIIQILDRFTFAETEAFLEQIRQDYGGGDLHAGLRALDSEKFRSKAEEWAREYIILRKEESRTKGGEPTSDYDEWFADRESSRG